MRKLLIVLLSAALAFCGLTAVVTMASAEEAPIEISTAAELVAINGGGNYVLTADIALEEGKYINSLTGTLNGNGHTVTINNSVGLINYLGKTDGETVTGGTVKNLTVAGTVKGTGGVAGVANTAIGLIENVTVKADVSSTSNNRIAGIANCNAKNKLIIKNCVFEGTVTMLQGYKSAQNYTYFGMFLGYNGGAFGGGTVVNSFARYTFTVPTSEVASVKAVEFYNVNPDDENSVESKYTTKTEGENTVYTFDCVVNMQPVTVSSVNDEGIMANYGTPVVRFTMQDGTYRYLDGFDRANASYVTEFEAEAFNKMYEYKDISYLDIKEIKDATVEEGDQSITSTYSEITVSSEEEFESFARIINSAIPGAFQKNGKPHTLSILNTLAIRIKLDADITLDGDQYGNPSEFYGLGKQEFFPYRAGIDGNGHTITLNINAPNGYCIGLIGAVSEMSEEIAIKNLTVRGSIVGKTKVGVVGYFDMVCTEYIEGANIRFTDVINYADVTGYTCVGGLLGLVASGKDYERTFVENCVNNGNVTVTANGAYGGGIVGCAGFYGGHPAGVSIKNTVNNGNVTAESGANYVGGIIGQITNENSVLQDVSNTGTITADSGKIKGEIAGESGAVKGNVTDGIGNYKVTSSAAFESKAKFDKAETTNTYSTRHQINVTNNLSKNYKISLIFINSKNEKWNFGSAEAPVYEREQDSKSQQYVITNLDPDTYTVKMVVRNVEGYYSPEDLGENGKVLENSATFICTKKAVTFKFADVTTAYTGDSVNYFTALDEAKYDKNNYKLPDVSADKGAKWSLEYYKDGAKLDGAPKDPGEYTVNIKLVATDPFKAHFDYATDTYSAKMTISSKITVTVNYLEITKGQQAEFTVTVTTYDGTTFTDIAGLNLKFDVNNMGSNTTNLPVMNYSVKVSGVEKYGDYDVEYKSGTLVVKDAAVVKPGDGNGEEEKKGCKLFDVRVLFSGLALTAFVFGSFRRKE